MSKRLQTKFSKQFTKIFLKAAELHDGIKSMTQKEIEELVVELCPFFEQAFSHLKLKICKENEI